MELIIDIDENVFTRLFDNGIEDYAIVNDDLFAIAKSIRKGVSFEKELEKIKTEIEELIQHCDTDYDFDEIYGIRQAIKIIDKHIAELKGENNEI